MPWTRPQPTSACAPARSEDFVTVSTRSPSFTDSSPSISPPFTVSVMFARSACARFAPDRTVATVCAGGGFAPSTTTASGPFTAPAGSLTEPTDVGDVSSASVAPDPSVTFVSSAAPFAVAPSVAPAETVTGTSTFVAVAKSSAPSCTSMPPARPDTSGVSTTSAPSPVFAILAVAVGTPCSVMSAAAPSTVDARSTGASAPKE